LTVVDNVVRDCTLGMSLGATDGYSVAGIARNLVSYCGTGMALGGLTNAHDNVVLHSTGVGIAAGVDSGILSGNVVGWSGGHGFQLSTVHDYYSEGFTLQRNTSFANGGSGFVVYDNDPSTGSYNQIDHNIGFLNHGAGLAVQGSVHPILSCNDWFANDGGAVTGMSLGASDLEVDPRFCDAAHDDVHLQSNSPLLDPTGCGLIGALGQGCEAVTGVAPAVAGEFQLAQIAPNPGIGPARVTFSLAREARVRVRVFDLQGRVVASLVDGTQMAGAHTVEWSSRSLPGTYLVAYEHPGGREVRRFVRLR
jgi:hypothetical protein